MKAAISSTTASMGGLLPGVSAGVYTATKIAAVGIMEALRVELESTNVGTSVFCPGGVNTDNYVGSGEDNPFRKAGAPALPPVGMDPLEAGERVLNGVVNNDLFISESSGIQAGHGGALRGDHGIHSVGGGADSASAHRL